jgi:Tfp pilus assembly protein PilX
MISNPSATRNARGFALVISLSLMVLLVVIAVGLLGLSAISLRSSTRSEAMEIAKANARMALSLALGELQKQAGPDQAITASSAILPGKVEQTGWTGTWSNAPNADPKEVRWLVSGDRPDPLSTGAEESLTLVDPSGATGSSDPVKAPAVTIDVQGQTPQGRYAWWIGDEGVKARVDIDRPAATPSSDRERVALSQSPAAPGLASLGDAWEKVASDDGTGRSMMISMPTAALATADPDVPADHFADLTTGGFGLPVNVIDGAMKADLSLIFDRSQKSKKYAARYFGGTAGSSTHNGAAIYQFTVSDPKKFYLSQTLSKNGGLPVGPNWGNLWNYATLWQNASGQEYPVVGAFPVPWADLRYRTWLPYTNHNAGPFQSDQQHVNSPLQPVVSLLQMGFRLKAKPAPLPAGSPPNATPLFRAQVELKPVFGLWNPYNVTLRAAAYTFEWGLYPHFRLNYAKPVGNGKFTDGRLTKLWLRDAWTNGSGVIPTPGDQTQGKFFSVRTDPVDIQPGEFRLFSVTDQIDIKAGSTYKLKPAWSEKGAFVVDLSFEAADGSVAARLIPSGYRAWFGDVLLQDTQSKETLTRYPSLDIKETASCWFTLKSGGNVLLRSTELWNGDPGATVPVPEPVVSGSSGGLDTTKETFLIDDLAGDGVVAHVATWSFFNRTSTQMTEPDQRLRGWIDSNPRSLVTNPGWDGSRVEGANRTGWHLTSHLMGGTHDPAPRGQVGDGNRGNRGLIGEGGRAEPEPQVDPSNLARYRGYGGPANTPAGQSNVVIYDVPRTPLVSIGQFQHAQLSRYNFEPGFVVGNSYANPRIPLAETVNRNFTGKNGLNIVDTSHEVNSRLWDGFFFSTLGIDYARTTGSSFDKVFDMKKLAVGETTLPNPRMVFSPQAADVSIDQLIGTGTAGERAPEVLASRILVKGAFNVNSTSVTAWKALLSTMGSTELPIVNPSNGTLSWESPTGIRFNRFGHAINSSTFEKGGSGDEPGFWQGWRSLSDDELDQLAREIVNEVKARGPFRSLGAFVNRDPGSSTSDHRLKGALQAAIDRSINAGLDTSVGDTAGKPNGSAFSPAISGESTAAGSAGYLLQGDVLQSLAPVLQARSDYFRIRTCGEALDRDGKVIARAWCEAFVQRTPDYIDSTEPAHLATAELKSDANRNFGRRYEIVSFRWLRDAGA